jgi:hypothetical protein
MAHYNNLKKEWEKAKKKLAALKKETVILAKKSEAQFKKISHQGKIHFDSAALNLRKDRLYYLIGKEFVRTMDASRKSDRLVELVEELKKINQQYAELKSKAKSV